MSILKYRPEIDGLRAIAIIPVILYHLAFGFPGGYVGVDVFFVISGYLITSLILGSSSAGGFGILDFWERRMRRILPAMALVILACLGAGWYLFIPEDFKNLGRSVSYQALFISNIFFLRGTGYFSSDDAQPLLHTWSLAIEEQFYILFPFLLILLTKIASRLIALTLGGLALISFSLSVYATYSYPISAFYLLPMRAWEFLLGALLAAYPNPGKSSKWINESLSWAGLAGISYAALFYNRSTPFPGMAALVPCVGTTLIIWTNSSSLTLVGKILSLRGFVFIGLISYSLYLWHWPVLIFFEYWTSGRMSPAGSLAIITTSLLLAFITWKVVETPFRKRLVMAGRVRMFAFAGIVLVTFLVIGCLINHADGIRSRWSPEALAFLDGQQNMDFRVELDLESIQKGNLTTIGYQGTDCPIDLLVWGDSHAMSILHVLNVVCLEHGLHCAAATHSATIPLLDFPCQSRYSLKNDTLPYNRAVIAYVRDHKIKNVLLVAAWMGYFSTVPTKTEEYLFKDSLIETIGQLHKAGARVFIMKDVPKQKFNVPKALAFAVQFGKDPTLLGLPISDYKAMTACVNGLLDEESSTSVILLDPLSILADRTGLCRAELDGRALYFDEHHLSIFGEMQLQPLFEFGLASIWSIRRM